MSEGTYTLDKLKAAMRYIETLPPLPIFASSKLFPSEKSIKWTDGRQDYVAAHPDFWAKLAEKLPAPTYDTNPWSDIKIVDIDLAANANMRAKVFGSIARVTGTIPPIATAENCR